jgi:nucleoside-diphosphate-sugar epimerase
MRVFVAGATGAVGRRLVPMLVDGGHEVVGMIRSPRRGREVIELGATPAVADGLDREAVLTAVRRAEPEVVVHEMTGLAEADDLRHFDRVLAPTNRLRTEGLDNLMAGARVVGARRVIAQSYGHWRYASAGPIADEDDLFDPSPPASMRPTLAAIRRLEETLAAAQDLEGIALRYGLFYGPGSALGADGAFADMVRARKLPLIGKGTGVWSFIHVDDAASAVVAALSEGAPGVYNIVDDDPAPVSAWLPALASALGARPPRRVPAWLARMAAGEAGVYLFTRPTGRSNAKAARELGWRPSWPTWREGFVAGLGDLRGQRTSGIRSASMPGSTRAASTPSHSSSSDA